MCRIREKGHDFVRDEKVTKNHLSLDVVTSDDVADCSESSRNHALRKSEVEDVIFCKSFHHLLIVHQKLNNSPTNSVVNHCLNLVIGTWTIGMILLKTVVKSFESSLPSLRYESAQQVSASTSASLWKRRRESTGKAGDT